MRRSMLHLAVLSIVAVAVVGCGREDNLTGPTAGARSSDRIPIDRPPINPRLGPNDFVEIVAGNNHTCARKLGGKVYCWGRDTLAQTGAHSPGRCVNNQECTKQPTLVMKWSGGYDTLRLSSIDAGANHTCGLDLTNAAWCWGYGDRGQRGLAAGTYGSPWEPLPVAGGLQFSSVGAGYDATCGTATSGGSGPGMYCWGDLKYNRDAVPTLVSPNTFLSNVTVGNHHACAMEIVASANHRAVSCWGKNYYGQLGIEPGAMSEASFSVRAQFGTSVGRVVTQEDFTCVDQTSGIVQCAGLNDFGQLGASSQGGWNGTPQTVGTLRGVATGVKHACALDAAGYAYCWGYGYWGQIGNGSDATYNTTPKAVVGGRTYRAIAAGYDHTCAIGTDNGLYCWGNNHHGQLGFGGSGSWYPYPVQATNPVN